MASDVMNPPDEVVRRASLALEMIGDGFGPASVAGLQVATALVAGEVGDVEVKAIRAGLARYDHDSVTAGLFGGPEALAWLDGPPRTAAVQRRDLHALSVRLNAINQRFRDRVETVISQSMRQAIRHATTKANVRAKHAATYKMAAVRDDFNAGHLTPAVLTAIGADMGVLLSSQFDSTSDHIVSLFDRRQADRRKALRAAGLEDTDTLDAQLDSWSIVEDQRRDTLRGFVFGGLMGSAAAYLTQPDKPAAAVGEVPRDVFAPPAIIQGTVRVADGADVTPSGDIAEPDGVSLPSTFDYTDQLVTDLLAKQAGNLVTTYQWMVGEPSRPFEPHQALDGVTFTDDTWTIVCANSSPDAWPADTLLPGDHDGCQCDLDVFYSDDEGDGAD